MKRRYQYRVEKLDFYFTFADKSMTHEDLFEELAREGWEVVQVYDIQGSPPSVIFKRKVSWWKRWFFNEKEVKDTEGRIKVS